MIDVDTYHLPVYCSIRMADHDVPSVLRLFGAVVPRQIYLFLLSRRRRPGDVLRTVVDRVLASCEDTTINTVVEHRVGC